MHSSKNVRRLGLGAAFLACPFLAAALLGLTAALLTPVTGPVLASPDTVIRVAPRFQNKPLSEIIGVDLVISDVVDLNGVDVRLTFNPVLFAALDADAVKAGVQITIGPLLSPDFVAFNVADNTAGTVKLVFTQLSFNPPVTGSGTLAHIDFRGLVQGTSVISFTLTKLSDHMAFAIAHTAVNGAISTIAPTAVTLSSLTASSGSPTTGHAPLLALALALAAAVVLLSAGYARRPRASSSARR